MKNKKIFIILTLAAIVVTNFTCFISFASADVSTPAPKWTGLVPCGRNSDDTGTPEDESAPCTLCHLIVGFQRLVQYGMYMVVTLALVGMFFAGVMYMVSSGDESMMTQAKGFLKVSLIGFAVVIGGWLIVNVTMWVLGAKEGSDQGGVLGINVDSWNKFTCDIKVTRDQGDSPISTPISTPITTPITTPMPATLDPVISLSPSSLTFPKTGVGSASSPQIITITNAGDGSLEIKSVQFSGTNASDFSQTNTCESELAKNASCAVSVTFKPTVTGERTAVLEIASNAAEKIKTANLSGTGGEKQCEFLTGTRGAKAIIMLRRAQKNTATNNFVCAEADWDANNNQSQLDQFKQLASSLASGLSEVPSADSNFFAVYRMDAIYDGSNDSKIRDIISGDCPEVNDNVFLSFGDIFNGTGDAACTNVHTKRAQYCTDDSTPGKSLAHEQVGHAFAQLLDEYPTHNISLGWTNVTKDNKCQKWQFIAPGCFQGCMESETNCFRSTENSIMRYHYEADGVFSPVQNYIIDACVNNFGSNCPPKNLIE